MSQTFKDLLDKLKQEDEVTVLEILDLSSEELIDMIESYIYDNIDRVENYYDCEDDDEE